MRVSSILYDNIAGSIGNVTGAMSQGGNYFKKKPIPSNPNTLNQQMVRNALKAANTSWKTMTEQARQLWKVYGATCKRTNNTGHVVVLNGWTAFNRAYVVFVQASVSTVPLLTAAPVAEGFHPNSAITITEDTTTPTSLVVENMSDVEINITMYLGKVTSEAINMYPASFNYNTKETIVSAGTATITNVVATGRNWYRFQSYSADGRLSIGQTLHLDS